VEAGDGTQVRAVTYVIEAWRDEFNVGSSWHPAGWLWRLAFDGTVAYGFQPRRAVSILAWLWIAFAAAYFILLGTRANTGEHGLFKMTPKGSVVSSGGALSETSNAQIVRVEGTLSERWLASLWFSTLSATRFGYGSFTLSSWLGGL
jgi:hypothetical protein